MFFTKDRGTHKDHITSFEFALRDASISDLNLVSVSSIKPPQCKIVNKDEGRKYLKPGQIVFTVMARSATNEPNRLIAASIGLARPQMMLNTGICQSTIRPENRCKGRRLCRGFGYRNAPQQLDYPQMRHLHGIKMKNNGSSQEKSTKRKISPNQLLEIRMVCGQQ